MDMGIEPFNVASALNLILAQRLVRRICSNCEEQYTADAPSSRGEGRRRRRRCAICSSRDMALENAKARATKEAAPLFMDITLDTTVSRAPATSEAEAATRATARGSRDARASTKS